MCEPNLKLQNYLDTLSQIFVIDFETNLCNCFKQVNISVVGEFWKFYLDFSIFFIFQKLLDSVTIWSFHIKERRKNFLNQYELF